MRPVYIFFLQNAKSDLLIYLKCELSSFSTNFSSNSFTFEKSWEGDDSMLTTLLRWSLFPILLIVFQSLENSFLLLEKQEKTTILKGPTALNN